MSQIKGIICCISAFLMFGCKEEVKQKPTTNETVSGNIIPATVGSNSSLPFLFSNGSETLLSWVEKEGDSLIKLKYANWEAGKWQPSQHILQGTDWFVNWADFPMIAENKGNLWSHVLKKSTSGTYSYDVKMNVSPKGSEAWDTNLPLHTDGTPTEHGFVTVLPYKEAFFVSWLDGRNTEANTEGERGAMTIRAAEVAADGTISNEAQLDAKTCDCCQTTGAITDNGPVVLYRDRSDTEIRDIYIVREVNGEWTSPKAMYDDGWEIRGCPVNGPKAAALGNTLAAAWFTEAQQKPRVQLVFSADGGANFDAPIQIATGKVLGRVDVLLVDTHTAIVSWMEMAAQQAVVKAVKVSRKGATSTHLSIVTLDASRKTGFPQMELVKDTVLFAWTDVSKPQSVVKTAVVSLDQF